MELSKGRGPFPTVMARIEVPSDMKQKREMDVRGLRPLEILLPTHFNIREMPFWI